MAKAQFHRHQKVWVESVGAWATIERIIPVWAKGFDEPVRITYEVGLGREFRSEELRADSPSEKAMPDVEGGEWRILRARNKWQAPEDCSHHPLPGTFPILVTDANDWGGWRVPGAEYDRDPYKIEHQSRLLASAPKLMRVVGELVTLASEAPDDCTPEILRLAQLGKTVLRFISDEQIAPASAMATE